MSDLVIVQQPTHVVKVAGGRGLPGATGPEGPQGDAGPTGSAGPPGGAWLFGVGNPSGVVSASLYDMYINTSNSDVYRSNGGTSWTFVNNIKGATGASGTNGTNGTNGTRGSLWTQGSGVPSAANNAGDMYLRTATNIGDVYQGNGGTSWTLIGNIRGAAGTNGTNGTNGADGDDTVFGSTLTATASYSTSLTTISGLTISGLLAGTYLLKMELDWDTDINTGTSWRINYSGTATNSNFKAMRYTASAIAFTQDNTLNSTVATSSTSPQGVTVNGMFVATTGGDLTVQALRAAGSSGTMHKGSYVLLKKVA